MPPFGRPLSNEVEPRLRPARRLLDAWARVARRGRAAPAASETIFHTSPLWPFFPGPFVPFCLLQKKQKKSVGRRGSRVLPIPEKRRAGCRGSRLTSFPPMRSSCLFAPEDSGSYLLLRRAGPPAFSRGPKLPTPLSWMEPQTSSRTKKRGIGETVFTRSFGEPRYAQFEDLNARVCAEAPFFGEKHPSRTSPVAFARLDAAPTVKRQE